MAVWGWQGRCSRAGEYLLLGTNRLLSRNNPLMSMKKKTLLGVLASALFVLAATLLPVETLMAQDAPAEAAPAAAEEAAPAEEPATLDSGDTAWMIVATALVLFMTIPGLSLFYGGLARRKNVLSILVQCFAITCLMTILWTIYGYSLAYTEGNAYIGGLGKAFLKGVGVETIAGSIPESVYFTFQMTFAIITPALIVGAFAERMKFSSVLVFMALWFTFSYLPIWHMVWGGGLIAGWGAIDFAGGTVVHINAGVAGLVTCIMLGKRKGYGATAITPHSVPLTVVGASMLWVGWFGFNAGSQLAADGTAGMALLVTQVATATAAFTWMVVEWLVAKKPTAVGIATGAVAGLVAITPASGSVGPVGALVIGIAAGVACYFCSTSMKKALGYDDSLDVFGVHGIGGIVGALLTGCLVIGAGGVEEFKVDIQLWVQFKAVIVTIIWSGVVALIAFKIADMVTGGARVGEDEEDQGLDLNSHGESGYGS